MLLFYLIQHYVQSICAMSDAAFVAPAERTLNDGEIMVVKTFFEIIAIYVRVRVCLHWQFAAEASFAGETMDKTRRSVLKRLHCYSHQRRVCVAVCFFAITIVHAVEKSYMPGYRTNNAIRKRICSIYKHTK